MYAPILDKLATASEQPISQNRKLELQVLVNYLLEKQSTGEPIRLNYICTHNSRRSQLSQVWSQVISNFFGINSENYSGGVEVTSFNSRAVASLERFGFKVKHESGENPHYQVFFDDQEAPIECFSKLFDESHNPSEGFAAVMTCSHADENCPFIPGTEKRIPLRYEDPKEFDDTDQEGFKYDERSLQIASELLYIFQKVKQHS